MAKIIVSACLAGIDCRYDGKNTHKPEIEKMVKDGEAIPACPEQMGGLTTPRVPAEIQNDKVITKDGVDVTKEFLLGAHELLDLIKLMDVKEVILQNRSPMCGAGKIYDGTFSGKLIRGDGILTRLIKENYPDIKITSYE